MRRSPGGKGSGPSLRDFAVSTPARCANLMRLVRRPVPPLKRGALRSTLRAAANIRSASGEEIGLISLSGAVGTRASDQSR